MEMDGRFTIPCSVSLHYGFGYQYHHVVEGSATRNSIGKEHSMNNEFFDAVKQGDSAWVRELVQSDPDLVNQRNDDGISPVLVALYAGKEDTAQVLIDEGVELDVFEAVATGRLERVEELLQQSPDLLNAYSADGFTPLQFAAFMGRQNAVDLLLARGANANAVSNGSVKTTTLLVALGGPQRSLAEKIIAAGADVNASGADGYGNDYTKTVSPLYVVARSGDVRLAELLLDRGADIATRAEDGRTPLAVAEQQGNAAMMDLLRRRGPRVAFGQATSDPSCFQSSHVC